jgi:hypothetical protein
MMPRPWTIFAWVLGIGLANAFVQAHLTWPQRIILGSASALMLWRIVYKVRKASKSMPEAQEEERSPQ